MANEFKHGAVLMNFKYYLPTYDKLEPHQFAAQIIREGRIDRALDCVFRWPDVFYDYDHYPTHRLELQRTSTDDFALVMLMSLPGTSQSFKCRDIICDIDLDLAEYLQYGHDIYLSLIN